MTLTERDVTALLRLKHSGTGNGGNGEWMFLAQVRNAAGFNATRTFDAMAMHLWPSRGHSLHIFEIKVSRSDWQRELAKPDKAEDAFKVADHFWIVAPSGCVRSGELPDEWGLIEVTGNGDDKPWKLRTKKAAPQIKREGPTKAQPLSRGLVASMMRSAPGAVPGNTRTPGVVPLEITEARQKGYEEGKRDGEYRARASLRQAEQDARDIHALREALVAHGVERYQASPAALARNADLLANAIKTGKVTLQLDAVRNSLKRALEMLDAAEEDLPSKTT